MILNAIALLFLIKLDDAVVTEQDYKDCRVYLDSLESYDKDFSKDDKKGCGGDCKCNCVWYYVVKRFGDLVRIVCYIAGFLAPIVIFICW